MTRKYQKVLSALCCLAMLLPLLPAAEAAEPGPVKSSNKNGQDYTTWASPVKSHLYENENGGLTRVEYTGGQVVVENYDRNFRYQSGRTIAPELPIWGGFFAGSNYNFLVFGQENPDEDNSREVIRVVKYDKNWNRLGQASLKGANTTVPFDAGSLRCDEYQGILYIRTCHEMYASKKDGLNHQANLTMAVRQSDMSITDSYYDVMNTSYGYVSHSFNQFLLVDRNGKLVALDHGDAYPRSAVFFQYSSNLSGGTFTGSQYTQWCSNTNLMEFEGAIGANTTGASVGGLAETSDGYVMAYTYDQAGGSADRYPYLHWISKTGGKSRSLQLIQTPGASTPVLASTGLKGGYMLWNGKTGGRVNDTLYYLSYEANGQPGEIQTASGSLSDCQPIFYNGKTVWYTTSNSIPTFYQLDSSGLTATQPGESAPVQPEQPETPSAPGTVSFSDVGAGDWFKPYVEKAAGAGLVNGTGNGKYDPYASLTVAQAMVLAYQLENQGGSLTAQSGEAWYMPYYRYCLEQGIVTAAQVTQSDLTRPASRFEMVSILDKAAPADSLKAVKTVDAIPDLAESDPYGGIVYRWYRAGIIAGDSAGRFNGDNNILRAEVAVILCKLNNL